MFSQKGLQRHPVSEWNESEVYRWLKQKRLTKLWRHFRDNKVDGKLLLQTTSKYLDRLGISNPTSRDKLLAAVHELKLFGGPVPDERQFRLNVSGTNIDGVSPRTKKRGRSLPTRPPNMQLLFKGALPEGIPSSRGFDVVERKTPQEVLHEQNEEISEDNEKGKVQVHTAGLQSDAEYTTIEITNQTTSKQLVSLLLAQCDAGCKDHNLFYIAVEIGIQKKDSSLPISQMMVLADDARPLEIQSRQPSGEAKFHLKMRSGGLLRVQAGILSPGATYKCVQISRQTRADEVVKMILSGYGSDEPPEKFVLVESLSSSEVGRILEADECPLEVQSRWKVGEQRTFTLTLAEFEGVLQSDDKKIAVNGVMDALQESSIDFDKNSLSEDQHTSSSASEIEGKENTEQIRKRRTSIDALDLHLPQVNQVKRKVSQIDNLRHKFHEYHRKPSSVASSDESSISGSEEGTKRRKVSQIDRFRSKFLAYAHNGGKGEAGSLNTLCENVREGANNSGTTTRTKTPLSRASSDGEDLPRFSSSPPIYLRDNNNGDVSQQNDKNLEHKRNNTVQKTSHPPRLSLATVLQYSKLITVTLNREPGEGWGIELVHVTKTGSSMSQKDNGAKDKEKVVYVLHSGNGQNSIVNTSSTIDSSGDLLTASGTSTPHSPSSSGSSEHEITSILGSTSRSCVDMDKSKDDMLHIVHMQNLRRRKTGSSNFNMDLLDVSPIVSRPGSARHAEQINSIPHRPSSAFAQWSKDGSPQPRPGVRIVALTEGGVAARSGEVAVDDLIVEINEHFVLNSPLEPVIAAMQEAHTVTIVVARAQDPELKPEEKENKTDYKEDIKELTLQIQNLVTKVSEMQNDLKKKDDKIKTLKKMVKKNTADSKGKIYQSVQVLV